MMNWFPIGAPPSDVQILVTDETKQYFAVVELIHGGFVISNTPWCTSIEFTPKFWKHIDNS